jgi:hypothetical protein
MTTLIHPSAPVKHLPFAVTDPRSGRLLSSCPSLAVAIETARSLTRSRSIPTAVCRVCPDTGSRSPAWKPTRSLSARS